VILISDPDPVWAKKTMAFLSEKNLKSEIVTNGKDCQLSVYKNKYTAVIIDMNTDKYPGLIVLKYLRLNFPEIKVILTFESKERFNEIDLSKEDLKKIGVSEHLVKPYTFEKLVKSLEGENPFDAWKNVSATSGIKEDEEITAKDQEFTRIKLEAFYSGNTTIFDHFIRLGPDKFIKILHKGDSFDPARIEKYSKNQQIEFLYFRTKDRAIYINYINQILEKNIASSQMKTETVIKTLKSASEKYIEEIYTVGLKPQLLEEGEKLCHNMYTVVMQNKDLSKIMRMYKDYDPPGHVHLFLVSFFSSIIMKNLDWASSRTAGTVAMAGLVHDIGKLKLPPELRDIRPEQMNSEQKSLYVQHPHWGAEMLKKCGNVPVPVIQIVYQHHECVNGKGFPNEISGAAIYPLAKVVALADDFSNLLIENRISPLEGLKLFIPDKERTLKFDPMVIKSLVTGFLKDKP